MHEYHAVDARVVWDTIILILPGFRDIVEKIVKEGRVAGYIIIFIPTHRRFIKHRRYEIEFPLDDFNRIANYLEPKGFLVKR